VNIRNREHYIDLLIKNIFVDSISSQLTYFTEGFGDILVNPKCREEFLGASLCHMLKRQAFVLRLLPVSQKLSPS
jgi:hypothetical protein